MIEELKTFIAVVEYENFTKAGEILHLSQPSVSVHIKNLEKQFNTDLISRSVKQKNIVITESGRVLYKRAKEIIKILEDTKNEVENISNVVNGHLRIGASYTIGEYFLPAFLGYFVKKYPDVKIELIIDNTRKICEKVKHFKVDIGLIEGNLTSFEFEQEHFLRDNLVLMLPNEYEHIRATKDYSCLQNLNWVTREVGSATRESLNMFLNANKIVPKGIITLGSSFAVKEAVKNDLGITLISDFVVKHEVEFDKSISIIELDDIYKRYFSYKLPKKIKYSNAVAAFKEELSKNATSFKR